MLVVMDVAFRNLGWVAMQKGSIVEWGTITTKKDPRKSVKVSDDYAAQCAVLASELINVIKKHNPKGLLGELPSGSQSAISAKLLGGAVATVTAIVTGFNLPLEWISPGDSKKATLGRMTGTKEEVMDWARLKYPQHNFGNVATKFEHVADALMAYRGLQNGLLIRTFG